MSPEAKEALHQEARPGHEDERDGDLPGHEGVPDPLAGPAGRSGTSPVGHTLSRPVPVGASASSSGSAWTGGAM